MKIYGCRQRPREQRGHSKNTEIIAHHTLVTLNCMTFYCPHFHGAFNAEKSLKLPINTLRFLEIVKLMIISLVLQNVVNAKRIDKMAESLSIAETPCGFSPETLRQLMWNLLWTDRNRTVRCPAFVPNERIMLHYRPISCQSEATASLPTKHTQKNIHSYQKFISHKKTGMKKSVSV